MYRFYISTSMSTNITCIRNDIQLIIQTEFRVEQSLVTNDVDMHDDYVRANVMYRYTIVASF